MSKFKVGDKVRVKENYPYGSSLKTTHVLTIDNIESNGWVTFLDSGYHLPISKLEHAVQSPKNQVIDQMNEESNGVFDKAYHGIFDLAYHDSFNTKETPVCYHDWQDVLLFTSTVTECKKCGITKEKHYDK